jgi:AraC-like DNA-binding protein
VGLPVLIVKKDGKKRTDLKELDQLKKYLLNPGKEKVKDYLVFPLFNKLFGKKFKKESDASGADIYIEGQLLVELKSNFSDYKAGFYQALHYAKKGLTFSAICVIAQKFIAVWKVNEIPDDAKRLAAEADANTAPNEIGRTNARKTKKAIANEILNSAIFKLTPTDLEGLFKRDFDTALPEFVQVLKNLEAERIQINTHNFIDHIAQLERFFDDPLDAIHCFYAIVGFWDVTSKVAFDESSDKIRVFGNKGTRYSEELKLKPRLHEDFKKFVENRYVFTNEGSGLTVDYYFSRFDEVITRIKPEYAKQHGIFFTDNNLSKFALWFVHELFEKRLSDRYIVLDPAGGSGNLVTSWKGHLKHKVISELQPDLLSTIERRMKLDPIQIEGGFTIIPKTSKNKGLNFLDKSAEQYVSCLMEELKEKNFKFDKPIAFLLNPPYKNTDENVKVRNDVEAAYQIHPSIWELTGHDAGKERYLAFLGQIINIARLQMGDLQLTELKPEDIHLPAPQGKKKKVTPLILIFTPTSWLIPRPTYVPFREIFDVFFKYEMGFIFLGNEFFKIKGRFPISFTIWSYRYKIGGNKNRVIVKDLTHLRNSDLDVNWNLPITIISNKLKSLVNTAKDIQFNNTRGDIRTLLPKLTDKTGKSLQQPRLNLYRNRTREEENKETISGFPLNDDRHIYIRAPHGFTDGRFIGFMDDNTPVRTHQDTCNRMTNRPDRVWFRLDVDLKGMNRTRCLGGCPDNRGYCAYDLNSAKATFLWFALTKALNQKYPIWANQFDIWAPRITSQREKYFYSLCYAFGLADNVCVVTKFEKDNPVDGAPEVFVDNPLCPTNPESFWSTTLDSKIISRPKLASDLVGLVKGIYRVWNLNYCKGQNLYSVGLQDEPYFNYFDYKTFLTPYSGLIQIRKYAVLQNAEDLLDLFEKISTKTKDVREEIFRLLTEEFGYFE